jgi:putative selenium metabolism hydrolase
MTNPYLSTSQQQSLLAFCQRIVRIPSYSGEEGSVAAEVIDEMRSMGFDSIETDACGSVIGTLHGDRPGPSLLFDAHMDVVPITSPENWKHAPFGAELEDGKLWGRGSADTKGSLAGVLHAVAALPRSTFAGTVYVAATVAEENLTGAAVTRILQKIPVDVFVTGEPTSLRLGVAQKGRLTLALKAHGRAAHTSHPENGINAVYKMMEVIQRLRAMPTGHDPLVGPSILELTEMVSEPLPGTAFVPDGCTARMVGRTIPGDTDKTIFGRIDHALTGLEGVEVALDHMTQPCYTGVLLETDDFIPGWKNNPTNPYQERILKALAHAGLPADPFGFPGGTNASASAGMLGIPSFIYGPGSLDRAHIVDEWVSVEELFNAALGFQTIALACLGIE